MKLIENGTGRELQPGDVVRWFDESVTITEIDSPKQRIVIRENPVGTRRVSPSAIGAKWIEESEAKE